MRLKREARRTYGAPARGIVAARYAEGERGTSEAKPKRSTKTANSPTAAIAKLWRAARPNMHCK